MSNLKEILGSITIILAIVGHFPYIIDVLKAKTKPHILTWLIWSVIVSLAFFAQLAAGGGPGSWGTGVTAFMVIVITVLSVKKGTKDITKTDKVLFVSAILAVILWLITKNPTLSMLLIATIDMCAFLPTIRKTFNDPKSETFTTYAVNVLRHGLSIFALSNYNLATILYPVYLLIMNLIMVILQFKIKK